jgi:hypothetical protein
MACHRIKPTVNGTYLCGSAGDRTFTLLIPLYSNHGASVRQSYYSSSNGQNQRRRWDSQEATSKRRQSHENSARATITNRSERQLSDTHLPGTILIQVGGTPSVEFIASQNNQLEYLAQSPVYFKVCPHSESRSVRAYNKHERPHAV